MTKVVKFGRRMGRQYANYKRNRRIKRIPRGLIIPGSRKGYYRTKFTGNMALLNSTSAGTDMGQSYLLHYPSYLRDTSGVIVRFGVFSKHYQKCFAMFDEYKVNRLSVEVRHPYTKVGAIDSIAGPTGNLTYPIIFAGRDDDSDELITEVSDALTMVGRKRGQLQGGKAFRISQRPAYLDRKKWFNCSVPNPNNIPVQADTITDKMPPRSSTKIWLENTANANYGFDVLVTWDVTFRGLNLIQNSLSTDIYNDNKGHTGTGTAGGHDITDTFNSSRLTSGAGVTAGYIVI